MNQFSSRVYQNPLIDLKDAFHRDRSSLSGYLTFASGRDGQPFTVDSSNPKVVVNAGNTIPTVKDFKLIKIEELKVKGMIANHKLGLAISYLGFDEFRGQIEYKCKIYGPSLVLVAQWFPSSLTCSICGNKQDRPRLYQDL
jgi:IS605 OrfB family transposase